MFSFLFFSLRALIAQSVEHGANNARVVGSSPTGSIFYLLDLTEFFFPYPTYAFLFLLLFNRGLSSVVEQLTPDQPVSGSIPLVLTFLCCSYVDAFMLCYSYLCWRAPIAQSVEHGANNARVVGSSPTGSIFYLLFLWLCLFVWERVCEWERECVCKRESVCIVFLTFWLDIPWECFWDWLLYLLYVLFLFLLLVSSYSSVGRAWC